MRDHRIAIAAGAAICLGATVVRASEGGEQPSLFTGDLGNVFWSLLTFAAVLVVLGKFAWKPILDGLKNRETFIRDSLAQAKKDRDESEVRLKQYVEKLDSARAEATAIVEEGRRDAEVVKRGIEEDARAEATRATERAKREIELATETAIKELYTLSATLATDVASRVLNKNLDAGEHERLIQESLQELEQLSRN